MKKRRLFEILDEMNMADTNNKTRTVAISNHFISADKVKQGAKICIGADEQCLYDLMNNKAMAVLLIVNKEEYFKRENVPDNYQPPSYDYKLNNKPLSDIIDDIT